MNTLNRTAEFPTRAFAITILLNMLWINASEVFRYFAFVMPMMRDTLSEVENVAPMDWTIFLIWGVWDTILVVTLTLFIWLFLERFGYGYRSSIVAAIMFWLAVFVILWLGLFNMNLTSPKILMIALPLALLEVVVAALIINWQMTPLLKDDSETNTASS